MGATATGWRPNDHTADARDALALSGLTFDDEDQKAMLQAANQNLARYEDVRKLHIPNDVAPPFYFSPIVPGMKVNRTHCHSISARPAFAAPPIWRKSHSGPSPNLRN